MATIFGERLLHLQKAYGLTPKKPHSSFSSRRPPSTLASVDSMSRDMESWCYRHGFRKQPIFCWGCLIVSKFPSTPDALLTPPEWEPVGHCRQLPLSGRERALGYLQGAAESK